MDKGVKIVIAGAGTLGLLYFVYKALAGDGDEDGEKHYECGKRGGVIGCYSVEGAGSDECNPREPSQCWDAIRCYEHSECGARAGCFRNHCYWNGDRQMNWDGSRTHGRDFMFDERLMFNQIIGNVRLSVGGAWCAQKVHLKIYGVRNFSSSDEEDVLVYSTRHNMGGVWAQEKRVDLQSRFTYQAFDGFRFIAYGRTGDPCPNEDNCLDNVHVLATVV